MNRTASKTIFLLTSAILGIIALISVYLVLISTGVIKTRAHKLIVSAVNVEKEYDGTKLEGSEYQIVYGNLLKGHKIEVYFSGEQTEVGSGVCEVSAKITDSQGADVTKEYDIEYVSSELKVTKRSITIVSGSREKFFDNTPLLADVDEYDIVRGSLLRGHKIKVSAVSEITKVGEVDNVISASIVDGDEIDVTDNYDINYSFGKLSVLPNELSVNALSKSFVFDGNAHTESGYVVQNGKDRLSQLGHKLQVETKGEITFVGRVANTIEVKVLDADGVDVSNFWSIVTFDGWLEVTPKPITLYTNSCEKIYDGTPLNSEQDAYLQPEGLVFGHRVEATCVGTQTNVGESPNAVSDAKVFDELNNELTENYIISFVFGYVTVNPIQIVVWTDGGNWAYDGLEHTKNTANDWDYSGTLVEGHTLDVSISGAITEIGTAPNECFAKVLSGETDVSSNYVIFYEHGDLIVFEKDLTIYVKTPSIIVDYDGLAHFTDGSLVQITDDSALLEGHTIDLTQFTTSQCVDAGMYYNKVESFLITDDLGNDVTASYSIGYKDQSTDLGTITINKRVLKIKTQSATKEYDGTPLTNNQYEIVDISAVAPGQIFVGVNVVGYRTVAGSSQNTADVLIYDNGVNVSENYRCDESYLGALEVTPITATIMITQTVAEYTVGSTLVTIGSDAIGLISGDTFVSATYLVPELEGAYYPYNVEVTKLESVVIVNSEGKNVSNCYNYVLETRWVSLSPKDWA